MLQSGFGFNMTKAANDLLTYCYQNCDDEYECDFYEDELLNIFGFVITYESYAKVYKFLLSNDFIRDYDLGEMAIRQYKPKLEKYAYRISLTTKAIIYVESLSGN